MKKPVENNRMEFKRRLNDKLEKTVVGFLNYRYGGEIIIGMDDDGTVYGVTDPDQVQLQIKDRLKTNICPSVLGLYDIFLEEYEGKPVIRLKLASGPEKPYYLAKYGMTEKGCFIRSGSATEPMPRNMIESLFAKRTRNSLRLIPSPQQDLRFSRLRIYYDEAGKPLNDRFPHNLEFLTPEGKYNYTAYLLADKNNVSIQVAKYAGTDRVDLIENNEYGFTSLIKATEAVLDKLEIENRTFTRITSKRRMEQSLWDPIAVREAVINAMVHNDYTRELSPKFEIFSDRLEITSYGGLFEGMTMDDFFSGLSMPVNKELMRVFKDLDMVEQLGSGIPRILRLYPKSVFVFGDNFLRIVFPFSHMQRQTVSTALYSPGKIDSLVEKVGRKLVEKMNATQQGILHLIKEQPAISKQKMAKELGVSTTSIDKNINKLKEWNVLRRIGPDRGGYWQIIVSSAPEPDLTPTSALVKKVGGKLVDQVGRKILILMAENPAISKSRLARELNVSTTTVDKYLKRLKQQNLIRRVGPARGGYWQILDNNEL